MAAIEKRSGKWRVRWREADGREHSRICPTKETAKALARQIESNLALGLPGLSERVSPIAITDAIKAYIDWSRVVGAARNSILSRQQILLIFAEWWTESHPRHTMADLSVSLLDRYAAYLFDRPSRQGDRLAPRTRTMHLTILSTWWRWCADRYPDQCARWRKFDIPHSVHSQILAPTWAEMDAFCRVADPPVVRDLAVLLRYTGLRVQQALALEWGDVDFDRRSLRVRAETEKTKRPRTIPIHTELLERLSQDRGIAGSIFRLGCHSRTLYQRVLPQIWKAAQVRDGIGGWHAFRRGFETGLAMLGVDLVRIRKIIGHSLGVDDSYLDAAGLDLREAVERIPRIAWADRKGDLISLVSVACPAKKE